jgi:hypothetical protein
MPFYLFSSKYPQFDKDEVHLLNNNSEAEKLLKSDFHDEYKYKCANSLTELVFFATPKDEFFFCPVEDFLECCQTTFEELCKKFGDKAISNAFPNDKFDTKMVNELSTKIRIYLDDEADAWRKAELEDNYADYNNPEIDAAEDEMRRWDEEDPSWRIANDID